jgi:hypothetical protein
MKNIIKLEHYFSPDVFFGRDREILARMELIKQQTFKQQRTLYLEKTCFDLKKYSLLHPYQCSELFDVKHTTGDSSVE